MGMRIEWNMWYRCVTSMCLNICLKLFLWWWMIWAEIWTILSSWLHFCRAWFHKLAYIMTRTCVAFISGVSHDGNGLCHTIESLKIYLCPSMKQLSNVSLCVTRWDTQRKSVMYGQRWQKRQVDTQTMALKHVAVHANLELFLFSPHSQFVVVH